MEVATVVPSRLKPCSRAARKTEWLRSALAHHHRPEPDPETCFENEIVVLATGIDQYLQEVFHHLAHPNRDDTVSAEDFTVLCAVLGLSGDGEGARSKGAGDGEKEDEEEELVEFQNICSGLPGELSFKDFHSRLCEYFRVRKNGSSPLRLAVTEETELVEREIRLRWPRVRRRKYVSFDLSVEQSRSSKALKDKAQGEPYETAHLEAAALRELVEDLRSALQGSDARCLALEVALRRERAQAPTSHPMLLRQRGGREGGVGGGDGMKRGVQSCHGGDPILRELRLIRSSRDGQLEEAIKFNQRLEDELCWAYEEVRRLAGVDSALRKENAKIRRRAEEAREALKLGLQRVRMIQEEAQTVPELQNRVTQLETELQQYRSHCTCMAEPTHKPFCPMGEDDTCGRTGGECLQRAVEGRAASDEEDEERSKGRKEEQCCLSEMKKLISRLHGCGNGCPNSALNTLLSQNHHLHDQNPVGASADVRGRGRNGQPQPEKGQRQRGEEGHRLEETERARLSLLEEKLTDALTLLLQLRNKNVSRRALGKILMDTLDICSRNAHAAGPSQVLRVADALCAQLSSSELLRDGGVVEGGAAGGGGDAGEGAGMKGGGTHMSRPSARQAGGGSTGPLIISC